MHRAQTFGFGLCALEVGSITGSTLPFPRTYQQPHLLAQVLIDRQPRHQLLSPRLWFIPPPSGGDIGCQVQEPTPPRLVQSEQGISQRLSASYSHFPGLLSTVSRQIGWGGGARPPPKTPIFPRSSRRHIGFLPTAPTLYQVNLTDHITTRDWPALSATTRGESRPDSRSADRIKAKKHTIMACFPDSNRFYVFREPANQAVQSPPGEDRARSLAIGRVT
jgi:hypothetical protein